MHSKGKEGKCRQGIIGRDRDKIYDVKDWRDEAKEWSRSRQEIHREEKAAKEEQQSYKI